MPIRADSGETDFELKSLFRQFETTKGPIEVNCRQLVSWMPYQADRSTHLLHPYPAKLLPHIPYFFLNNRLLSKPGDLVVDTFCGSGTVLVESLLSGRCFFGIDCNPLSILLSNVKTTAIRELSLRKALKTILYSAKRSDTPEPPDVINLKFWYFPRIIRELSQLREQIARIDNETIRSFFWVCFSVCVRRLSLADPRISVPVKLRKDRHDSKHPRSIPIKRRLNSLRRADVFSEFEQVAIGNLSRISSLEAYPRPKGGSGARLGSALSLSESGISSNSASLIITSPPYAGAQKYVRASSLSLNWLGLCGSTDFRSLERKTIGREHYSKAEYAVASKTASESANAFLQDIWSSYPLRAHIAANYLNEMETALAENYKALRPGGHLVLIAGDNRICGKEFFTSRYLLELGQRAGFNVRLQLVDSIRSRGLMTKRNKTAGVISREWITVFRK